MKYTDFEFQQVLAVLNQLRRLVNQSDHKRCCQLAPITTFNEDYSARECFFAFNLLEDSFSSPDNFCLLTVPFQVTDGKKYIHAVTFTMGTEQCVCISNLPKQEHKKVQDPSWEKVLAFFIAKIKYVVENQITYQSTQTV